MDYYMATKWIRSHDLPDLVPLSLHRGRGLHRKYTQHPGERERESMRLRTSQPLIFIMWFLRGAHEARGGVELRVVYIYMLIQSWEGEKI